MTMLVIGAIAAVVQVVSGGSGPFGSLVDGDLFTRADPARQIVALIAAMRDPIDWAHPLAISNLGHPYGTSMVIASLPGLFALPLRVLSQANVTFDAVLAMELVVRLIVALSPGAVYLLARTYGASRIAAAVSGAITLLIPAIIHWNWGITWPLSTWGLVAMLIRELVLAERGGRNPGGAALLAGALWWCFPYFGLMGGVLAVAHATRSLATRSLAPLLPTIGSLCGLATLRLFDTALPDGVGVNATNDYYRTSLWGLISLDPTSEARGLDIAEPAAHISAHPSEIQWGLIALVLFALSVRSASRVAPLTLLGAGALALLSLGTLGSGGLIPRELLLASPLSTFDDLDRLFLPAALLAMSIGPSVIESQLSRFGGRIVGVAAILALVPLSALYTDGSLMEPTSPIDRLQSTLNGREAPRGRAIPAIRDLISEHRIVVFAPSSVCLSDSAAAYVEISGQEMGIASLAALEGVPATAYNAARRWVSVDENGRYVDRPDRSAPDCDLERGDPPSGALVVVTTIEPDRLGVEPEWSLMTRKLAACSDDVTIGVVRSLRFCSDDVEAIVRFERRMDAVRPLEPRPLEAP
jgi:hypothetical protein